MELLQCIRVRKRFLIRSAQLTIISQPFPASVKQNKNLEETLSVRLLTGARTEPVNVQTTLKGYYLRSSVSKFQTNC